MSNETHMINGLGHLVPMEKVSDQDKLENQLVVDLFGQAQQLNAELARFKQAAVNDIDSFVQLVAEKYGITKGGRKGNLTLMSFDQLTKVQIAMSDTIAFGPELQVAKQLIDDFIKASSTGANDDILVLVNHAFAVDKQGKVNRANILGLRKLKIEAETWKKAMEAIADAQRVTATKQYLRFYRRKALGAGWEPMSLDFAAV